MCGMTSNELANLIGFVIIGAIVLLCILSALYH